MLAVQNEEVIRVRGEQVGSGERGGEPGKVGRRDGGVGELGF